MRRGGLVALATAIVAIAAGALPAFAAAPAATWTVQATAAGNNGGFDAVACATASACVAVGSQVNLSGLTVPFAESWDGHRWTVEAVPSAPTGGQQSELMSVSCAAANACMAVGLNGDNPLADWWNGHSWQSVPPAGGSASLNGVACPARAECIAVGETAPPGSNTRPALIETWNGHTWHTVPAPGPANAQNWLKAISCPSATQCVAVGQSATGINGPDITHAVVTTLVASWNGRQWALTPSPNQSPTSSFLNAVSCTSATNCIAAGSQNAPTASNLGTTSLAEHWNGHRWTLTPAPPDPLADVELDGASCASATACIAVGSSEGKTRTLIERWNGSSWSVEPSPNPSPVQQGHANDLLSVSCVKNGPCDAAGDADRAALLERATKAS